MTAPAINPAMNVLPGLAGGNGQPALGGALAGFEALLAALFGETDIAGAPVAHTPAAPANALFAPTEESAPEGATPEGASPEAVEDVATGLGPEAALNPLLMAQTAPPAAAAAGPSSPPPAAEADDAAPPAWGQAKAKAAPAGPAQAHADPHAQLAEKAADGEDQPEIPAPSVSTQPPKAVIPPGPQRGAAQAATPAATDVPTARPAAAHMTPEAAPMAPVAPTAPETPEPQTPAPATLAVETSQTAQAAEITRAADAPPPPPAGSKRKDKERSAEAVRSEPNAEAAAPKVEGAAARTPTPAPAPAPAPGDAKTDAAAKAPGFRPAEAEAQAPDAARTSEAATGASETRSTHASGAQAPAGAHPVRGAPETVANLAAQIVKKLDGRSTRFDVELDPIGLGKVDVRVEIGAQGRMTAAMTFETPQAAAELKSRAGELQRALEQAGFDLAGGGMSFDVAGGGGGHGRQEWTQDQGGAFRGRAFQQALETAGEADLAAASGELRLRRGVTGGVDVRI